MKNLVDRLIKFFNSKGKIIVLSIFIAIGSLILQTSCTAEKSSAVVKTVERNSVPVKQPVCLKIVVMPDRSGSIDSTRTPQITLAQLDKIVAIVRESCGEIAFGFIDDDSNQPFIRLRIELRPVPPLKPDEKNSPFDQEKLLADYKKQSREFKKLDLKWQTDTDREIENFKIAAQPLLDCLHVKKCRSGNTDVFEALRRADLFLNEKEKVEPTLRLMFLITDGLETVKPKTAPPALQSDTRITAAMATAMIVVL